MQRWNTSPWLPRIGWSLVVVLAVVFVWGLQRRAGLEITGDRAIRMLFVPSVEQGTLVRRGDELARFIRADSGLTLKSQVPTSYAAVIQALGAEQADVAWIPMFAYVIANARYGAEARLQVVRSVDRYAIVVTRNGPGEPVDIEDLAGLPIAVPETLRGGLRDLMVGNLDEAAPGWIEVPVSDGTAAVEALVNRTEGVVAAVSRHVYSGPHDLVGDGRKLLESKRRGTLRETRVMHTTETSVPENSKVYYGCILTRPDSGFDRVQDLQGRTFAFSDETSTSGHIFPRALLQINGVSLGHLLFAGGHPNVVQAVADGKVDGGSSFYSPPSKRNAEDQTFVGDARFLLMKNMATAEERRRFLDEVRVIALTEPIPNDVCCVRKGFPESTWREFEVSLQRFLATDDGKSAYHDLVAGVAADPCTDADFEGFRQALADTGISAVSLLNAAEEKLEKKRQKEGADGS